MSKIVYLNDLAANTLPANSIYIEVGSKWANPFITGKDGNQEECIELYKKHLASNPEMLDAIDELEGKDLLCYHAPHANVLLELAGMTQNEREHWADRVLGIS